ncbi:MAG: hypothetical protein K6F82_07070 [Sphaerochaetaceae bacterium]|nr:hypothetical protein [Sphaerochaetaceae bacterium]
MKKLHFVLVLLILVSGSVFASYSVHSGPAFNMYRTDFKVDSTENELKADSFGFVVEGSKGINEVLYAYANVGLSFPVDFYSDGVSHNSDNLVFVTRVGSSYNFFDDSEFSVSAGGGLSFVWANYKYPLLGVEFNYSNYAIGLHAKLEAEYSLSKHFSVGIHVSPDMLVYQVSKAEYNNTEKKEGAFRLGFNGTASVGVTYNF